MHSLERSVDSRLPTALTRDLALLGRASYEWGVHTEQTDAPERSVTLNALPGVQQAEPHRQGWEPVQRFGDAESPIR